MGNDYRTRLQALDPLYVAMLGNLPNTYLFGAYLASMEGFLARKEILEYFPDDEGLSYTVSNEFVKILRVVLCKSVHLP